MKAVKVRATVRRDGRLTMPRLPLRRGAQVEVIVPELEPRGDELLRVAETRLSFWDNTIDDEVWNDA
jgi:hypothetical protein